METLTLDEDMIVALQNANGCFTGATVRALGLNWHTLEKGWPARLVGTSIALEDYERALAGRDILSKGSLKRHAKQDRRAKRMHDAVTAIGDLDTAFDRALARE